MKRDDIRKEVRALNNKCIWLFGKRKYTGRAISNMTKVDLENALYVLTFEVRNKELEIQEAARKLFTEEMKEDNQEQISFFRGIVNVIILTITLIAVSVNLLLFEPSITNLIIIMISVLIGYKAYTKFNQEDR